MTDPFGALAMQRKGDLGIFNGHQYVPSSGIGSDQGIHPTVGTGDHLGIFDTQAVGQRLDIMHGSFAHPMTSDRGGSTVNIARIEKLSAAVTQGGSAALEACVYALDGRAAGLSAIAILGNADSTSTNGGDIIGGGFRSVAQASSAVSVWGIVASAKLNNTTTSTATGAELSVENGSGVSLTYSANGDTVGKGLSITSNNFSSGASIHNGVGVSIGNNSVDGTYDVGVAINHKGAAAQAYRDDSDATSVFVATGSHTTGIDLSGATISGISFRAPAGGRLVLGTTTTATYEISYNPGNMGILFQTGGTHYPYIFYNGNYCLYMDDVNLWTPTANQTAVHFYEGVTPTKRRVQWMDPGVGGINFVGGEMVMVLV